MQELLEAARAGLALVPDVEVVVRPALSATASDLLAADGVLLGTPANIGYMSGALKHFFDTAYYPCLDATVGTPYALYVHGQSDTTGAVRSVETITTALKWRAVAPPLTIVGSPTAEDRAACQELAGVLAATVLV
jgi:NAD(P)H-dependent FMN reductase